jgi:tetratricopeptide (TPR) repeat protein
VLILFVTAILGAAHAAPLQPSFADDPDRLYADRENLASAQRAAAIWEVRLRDDPASFESAWKLARITYWLGGHVAPDGQRREYERGVEAGRRAVAISPQRPEGYFWMAANMGALAESFGLRAGLRYRGAIREALEVVLKIDPAFLEGSADRALGRWFDRVPRLFGGSDARAVEHLQRSLAYNPDSTISHFFLAEVLLDMDRREEARAALQKVLDVPLSRDWAPEDRAFKQKARARLEQLD